MEDQIITFATYYDAGLENIIRAKLEAFEIPCFLADETSIGLNPFYNQALGGIKLKIFAKDFERCQAVLTEEAPED